MTLHRDSKPFELSYMIGNSKSDSQSVEGRFVVHWLIKASQGDTNPIPIRSASGFQRFIISVALRLAFSRFTNQAACSQFFIDEGFTTCDHNNITMVPPFLQRLLHYFDSIIIVSHIEYLLDHADQSIKISSKPDRSSLLQSGQPIQLTVLL